MTSPKQIQPRAYERFPLETPVQLRACPLPLIARANRQSRCIEAQIQNISSGGMCVLTLHALEVSELLLAEIAVPSTRAGIPTLLQVRWLEKSSNRSPHRAGLGFVLQGGIPDFLRVPAPA